MRIITTTITVINTALARDLPSCAQRSKRLRRPTTRSKRKWLRSPIDDDGDGNNVAHRRCLDHNDRIDYFRLLPDELLLQILPLSYFSLLHSTEGLAVVRTCTRFWSLRADVWTYIFNNPCFLESVVPLDLPVSNCVSFIPRNVWRERFALGLARIWANSQILHTPLLKAISEHYPDFIGYTLKDAVQRQDLHAVGLILSHETCTRFVTPALIDESIRVKGEDDGDDNLTKRIRILELLLGVCDPCRFNFFTAMLRGHNEICLMLLRYFPVNEFFEVAVRRGLTSLVNAMLADPNHNVLNMDQGLYDAAKRGHQDIFLTLVAHVKTTPAIPVLYLTLHHGRPECCRVLMEHFPQHAFLVEEINITRLEGRLQQKISKKRDPEEDGSTATRTLEYCTCLLILQDIIRRQIKRD